MSPESFSWRGALESVTQKAEDVTGIDTQEVIDSCNNGIDSLFEKTSDLISQGGEVAEASQEEILELYDIVTENVGEKSQEIIDGASQKFTETIDRITKPEPKVEKSAEKTPEPASVPKSMPDEEATEETEAQKEIVSFEEFKKMGSDRISHEKRVQFVKENFPSVEEDETLREKYEVMSIAKDTLTTLADELQNPKSRFFNLDNGFVRDLMKTASVGVREAAEEVSANSSRLIENPDLTLADLIPKSVVKYFRNPIQFSKPDPFRHVPDNMGTPIDFLSSNPDKIAEQAMEFMRHVNHFEEFSTLGTERVDREIARLSKEDGKNYLEAENEEEGMAERGYRYSLMIDYLANKEDSLKADFRKALIDQGTSAEEASRLSHSQEFRDWMERIVDAEMDNYRRNRAIAKLKGRSDIIYKYNDVLDPNNELFNVSDAMADLMTQELFKELVITGALIMLTPETGGTTGAVAAERVAKFGAKATRFIKQSATLGDMMRGARMATKAYKYLRPIPRMMAENTAEELLRRGMAKPAAKAELTYAFETMPQAMVSIALSTALGTFNVAMKAARAAKQSSVKLAEKARIGIQTSGTIEAALKRIHGPASTVGLAVLKKNKEAGRMFLVSAISEGMVGKKDLRDLFNDKDFYEMYATRSV